MRALLTAMAMLAAAVLMAAPAQACMYLSQHLPAFWKAPSASVSPGEVVLEVQFTRFVTTTGFQIDCGAPNYAYAVKRVIGGRFEDDIVVVMPMDYLAGETLNPWATRILVGTIEEQADFVWREGGRPFTAPVLRHRPPPDTKTPSGVEEFFRNAETSVFFTGYLIQYFADQSDGQGGVPWIGLAVLALLLLSVVVLAFWLVRRLKRTPV
jgi:hypothetical protein